MKNIAHLRFSLVHGLPWLTGESPYYFSTQEAGTPSQKSVVVEVKPQNFFFKSTTNNNTYQTTFKSIDNTYIHLNYNR